MFSPCHRLLLVLALAASPLASQVHEAEPPLDLERGLVLSDKAKSAVEGFSSPAALKTNVGQNTFAISLLMSFPSEAHETVMISQWHDTQGWRFLVTADGALRFEGRTEGRGDPILVSTGPGVVTPDTQRHLVLNVLRDATKPNAGIWVDGVEIASGVVPPLDLNPLARFLSDPQLLKLHVASSHFRLYHRELTRPEILALYLQATALSSPAPRHAESSESGPRLSPDQDETIALLGGTEAVALAESGELEAMLLLAFPEARVHLRSLAWEGDTVFHQDRPMNFGSLEQQLRRVNAGTVIMIFGRQEAIDASSAGMKDFEAAYDALLGHVKMVTPNIVIAAPPRLDPLHAAPAASLPLAGAQERLQECYIIMKRLAEKHGVIYADASKPMILDGPPRVRDGVTLTATGVHEYAVSLAYALRLPPPRTAATESLTSIVTGLQAKNRLWHNYWRPTNWAFLHGDRTQQPSSRDPVNPQLRFFPTEQEKYLPLIKEAEERIYRLVDEAVKKLP